MSGVREGALTDQEREILADEMPPRLHRWDVSDPPQCQHCSRSARYGLVFGNCADGPGLYKKDVCDACLERIYGDLEIPLTARIHNDQHSR